MLASQPEGKIAMTMKEQKSGLTVEWLRENMDYAADTGVFMWKKPGFGRTVGKVIGSKMWSKGRSYLTMKVDGTVFYAHRLAWFYHYGEWPNGSVDHIDADRTNNAMDNLRLATPAQNAARRTTHRGIAPSRGVFPHGPGYVARLHHAGKRHYLGYFSTAEEARAVYEAKAKEIHGEFAYPSDGEMQARGDYVNVPKCEMCGKEGSWGNNDIRHDTTPMGLICGAICNDCWCFASQFRHDKKELQRMSRLAAAYFDKVDVFDFDDPRYREDVIPVSMGDLRRAKEAGTEIRPENTDG